MADRDLHMARASSQVNAACVMGKTPFSLRPYMSVSTSPEDLLLSWRDKPHVYNPTL